MYTPLVMREVVNLPKLQALPAKPQEADVHYLFPVVFNISASFEQAAPYGTTFLTPVFTYSFHGPPIDYGILFNELKRSKEPELVIENKFANTNHPADTHPPDWYSKELNEIRHKTDLEQRL